jgi:hypothetical protein
MSGQFVDGDGRWRSAHRLSTAASVQWGTARGLIRPWPAAHGQRSLETVLSDSVAVVSLSTPARLRLSDFAAALMAGTHAVDCAQGRVDGAFPRVRVARQHLDRRWWGPTR